MVTLILAGSVTLLLMCFKPSTSSVGQVNLPASPDVGEGLFSDKSSKNVTTMLIWSWPFGKQFNLTVCDSVYNIKGCFLTIDRNFYNMSDAVLIHNQNFLPTIQRPPFQRWIWMNFESPSHYPKSPEIENLFNLTVNYRRDADIKMPYGSIEILDVERDLVLRVKNKLLCWVVSDWKERYVRSAYYYELRKYVPISGYGKYFGKPLTATEYYRTLSKCKFYLALENSIHMDYITEKFFNALSLKTVPVVLGPPRENYERIIQGDAFIHVDDFKSPKELADYLLLLDKNEEMYLKYFEWQRHFKVKKHTSWEFRACRVCDHVRRHKEYKTINLHKWFWDE
ncbi:4-galactosyl-N-acetylglucosaminide 3-alpha-L-fucosyltransferase 9-like [Antennarius striatus]|uniref:4-galactosyl-N-acetylglucosaminide 3-alpha-L-fucosyltransferase 9-like n=1 Tax=Antennarius striatus TaxID=241820 RepID=UPI0035B42EBB